MIKWKNEEGKVIIIAKIISHQVGIPWLFDMPNMCP